jgi:hypothetical protein
MPAILINDVHHAVDQRHIASQVMLHMQVGQLGDLGLPRIDYYEPPAIPPDPHQTLGGNGVRHCGIGTDD